MTDLQENRSLVRNLLNLGLDVYLIDYGYPGREDRWLTLDDFVNGYINSCVDYLRERYQLDAINFLGICQGGALGLCYASIYPEKIANLITMVTPVDFDAEEGLLNMWTGCQVGSESVDPALMVEALGKHPGRFYELWLPDAQALPAQRTEVPVAHQPSRQSTAYGGFSAHGKVDF